MLMRNLVGSITAEKGFTPCSRKIISENSGNDFFAY